MALVHLLLVLFALYAVNLAETDNLATVEKNLATVDKNLATVDKNLATVGKDLATVDKNLATVDKDLATVDKNLPTVDSASKPHNENSTIGFTAELSTDTPVAAGGTIEFDRVRANVGGLYVNNSGQFICADDGLYVFAVQFLKAIVPEEEGMRCIGMLHNAGRDVKYGPKTNYYSTTFGGGDMIVVSQCTTQSAFTVKSQAWKEGITNTAVYRQYYTTFLGFKLHSGIAFTVELSKEQYAFPDTRIRFDNVLANFGGYFQVIHNSFWCPDAGIYVFSVTAHTRDPSTPWSVSRLMMEGAVVMQGPMTYIATQDYDSGTASSTTVLQCTPGFNVYVEAQASHHFPHNSYGPELTSFSGFKLYDVSSETIAFSVVLTQNVTISSPPETIAFQKVVTNIGNAFNTSLSHFVCPDDAHYFFTWGTVSPTGSTYLSLYEDNVIAKRLYTTSSADSSGTSGSTSIFLIVQCQPGKLISIRCDHVNNTFLAEYTSFSGYKLPGYAP